jgi:hypothetical protein
MQGTLPGLCYAEGMTAYWRARQMRIFDYPRFAQPRRDAWREARRAAQRRYLELISTLADPRAGVEKLRKLSQTVTEHERSYPGFDLFGEEDQQLMQALARGEFNIGGLQDRTLRDHLPEKTTGQMWRLLKRLRLHGFIQKVGHTYRDYLTHFGKEIITAALKLKQLVLIPQLAFGPAS